MRSAVQAVLVDADRMRGDTHEQSDSSRKFSLSSNIGDAELHKKCLAKMSDEHKSDRTIPFVSYIGAVASLSEKCLLIDGGRVVIDGLTRKVMKPTQAARECVSELLFLRERMSHPSPHLSG
jgi:hypothetical protein